MSFNRISVKTTKTFSFVKDKTLWGKNHRNMKQNWRNQQHTHDKQYERMVAYSSMPRMKETYSVKSYLSS